MNKCRRRAGKRSSQQGTKTVETRAAAAEAKTGCRFSSNAIPGGGNGMGQAMHTQHKTVSLRNQVIMWKLQLSLSSSNGL